MRQEKISKIIKASSFVQNIHKKEVMYKHIWQEDKKSKPGNVQRRQFKK